MTFKKLKSMLLSGLIILIITVLCALFVFSGDNLDLLRSLFLNYHTPDELRDKLGDFGIKGYITIVFLSMLQVVLSILPAEPVQVLAGLAFGFPLGILLSTVGVFLGNTVIFLLYKKYGNSLKRYFVNNLHVDLDKAAKSAKLTIIIFILYFLPAIPYGMICFFAASVGMKYTRYTVITLLGALPSVCLGVGLGHIAIGSSRVLTLSIVAVLAVLILIVMLKKKAIFERVNKYIDKPLYSSKTTVRKYSKFKLSFLNVMARITLFFKGVRVKYTKTFDGDVEGPAIALSNHGSFVDFCYAGTLLRKKSPNFIVARLYFYKKLVGNILRGVGCFPKSMFASDLESAKNCLRVIKTGGILAMMPEARLSTVGKFEDIQEGTFAFLKQARVPVYQIRLSGDYLAGPKWGKKMRRGSLIEAELSVLFTREEIEALSVDEIRERVLTRMDYDEMKWLDTHPEIRYKSKRLAEGLENILTVCPVCGEKYTIRTKGREISCERCGRLTSIDSRYKFEGDFRFESFVEWYEWQVSLMREEILGNADYKLTSPVEYKLPSLDGRTMLRPAGEGTCTLSREGLVYEGTRDGEEVTLTFPMTSIYRLLFGAGENFEIYEGQTINYFRPRELRSAVDWYIASIILKDEA